MSLSSFLLLRDLFLSLDFVTRLSALPSAGNSTGPVSRAEGAIKGVSEITDSGGTLGTLALGVEKTLPLDNKASNGANCSLHWSEISFN